MGAQRGMETESGKAREMGRAEVAFKVPWVGKVALASGEGATLGHFCQDVDEVVQP